MLTLVKCFIDNESGSTALEYGLITAGIAVVAHRTERGFRPLRRPVCHGCRQSHRGGQLNRGADRSKAEPRGDHGAPCSGSKNR